MMKFDEWKQRQEADCHTYKKELKNMKQTYLAKFAAKEEELEQMEAGLKEFKD